MAAQLELHGTVLAPEPLGRRRIVVDEGRIAALDEQPAVADALGGPDVLLVPGLVDLQLNGAFGGDFWDDDLDLGRIRARLAASGVTTFLATLVSGPRDAYAGALARLAPADEPASARLAGVHLEGPWFARSRAGAHEPRHLRDPDTAELEGWLASGHVRLVTLAPELPGALDAIRALRAAGVVVAAGHTDASEAAMRAGLAAGIGLGTHLYNAMRPLHHREPGSVGALLDAAVPVSVIADGAHVAPTALRIAWRVLGPRLVAISDGVAGLGLPPGPLHLGGQLATSDGRAARLADGTLAGSVTGLLDGVRHLAAIGIPVADAVRAATATPAAVLGLADGTGRLAAGGRADVLVLGPDLELRAVVAGGEVVRADLAAGTLTP
jgi:N-acetylglucosamine-6-phosphate deacetylase